MNEQRRQYSRIAFTSPAQLLLAAQTLTVLVRDLSLRGALVELPAPLDLCPGAAAELRIALDDAGGQICMQASVAHIEERRAGLACRSIDVDSISHLRRLVALNAGDSELLQRELATLLAH